MVKNDKIQGKMAYKCIFSKKYIKNANKVIYLISVKRYFIE